MGILIATQVESISSRKDKTIKIVLGTQELAPNKAGELFNLQNGICSIYLKKESITQEEIDLVDSVGPEFKGKTQSQRLRNTLYVLFEQNNEGFNDFSAFYQHKTETIINHLKTKIK
jgi:hypothetical protein